MKIGIDLSCLPRDKNFTGVANYAFNLTRELLKIGERHEWVLFVNNELDSRPPTGQAGLRGNDRERVEIVGLPAKKIPFWTSHMSWAREMQKANLDLLHGPANVVPLTLYPSPARGEGTKVVITLHDLAIYKHPEWFPKGQWLSTKIVVPRSIKKAEKVIVPSQATANDLKELFRVNEERIAIVPLGVDDRFFFDGNDRNLTPASPAYRTTGRPSLSSPGERVKRKYILYVGTIEPRKNLTRLIDAYASLPKDVRDEYDLVIAGKRGWRQAEIRETRGIRVIGYVPDEDLPALYHGADVFVYPSLHEGFGLPVLEAMASGVPVITSKISSLPEIAGPSLLVNPKSPWQIGNAILKIIRDGAYASEISDGGMKWARKFTWEKTARETLKVYEEAGGLK